MRKKKGLCWFEWVEKVLASIDIVHHIHKVVNVGKSSDSLFYQLYLEFKSLKNPVVHPPPSTWNWWLYRTSVLSVLRVIGLALLTNIVDKPSTSLEIDLEMKVFITVWFFPSNMTWKQSQPQGRYSSLLLMFQSQLFSLSYPHDLTQTLFFFRIAH